MASKKFPLRAGKLTLTSMTIERGGTVWFRVTGDTHCGPKDQVIRGKVAVLYSVTVTCKPQTDRRGFLFDQAMVGKWFERQAELGTDLSCEGLAHLLAGRLIEKLGRDTPHCDLQRLELTLKPAPHTAGITVVFER